MWKQILTFLFLGVNLTAHAAYFQADLATENNDPGVGTHLIIVGKGIEFGDMWLAMGHGQALIFKGRPRHGRIRLISAIDRPDSFNERLRAWGYSDIQYFENSMTESEVVQRLLEVEKIASIDFLGHNGALKGLALESTDDRFFKTGIDQLKQIKSRFTPDSYIRISACNSGWNLAPYVANILGVPASGTLTSAGIQGVFPATKTSPSEWYFDFSGGQPANTVMTKVNSISYAQPVDCVARGGCRRLKPIMTAYNGKHGAYTGTLPFAKFFCGQIAVDDCARRAALAVATDFGSGFLAEPPSADQYALGVADIMCPGYNNLAQKNACRQMVKDHLSGARLIEPTYSPIQEPLLDCTFVKCRFKTVADVHENETKYLMVGRFETPSTTFHDELNFYKRGFEMLRSSELPGPVPVESVPENEEG